MSKELTEQWRNGAIQETYYYVKCPWSEGEVDIRYVHNGVDAWKEIVAPVPSYGEYQSLKDNCDFTHICLKGARQKITQLEKQLDIATKALKKIDPKSVPFEKFKHRGAILRDIAQQALKDIDLVGTLMSLAKEEE